MAMMASAQPIVRNTFWELELDGTEESDETPFPCLRRSNSDYCINYANLDHEVCSIFDHKNEASDSSTMADTSDAGSVAGSDDHELWSEMMSVAPGVFSALCQNNGINEVQKMSQTAFASPGVFSAPCQNTEINEVQKMRPQTASAASAEPVRALAVDCLPPAAATPAFREGMQIEVFSISEDRWLAATISEVAVAAGAHVKSGCKLPAGSVCVLYTANNKAKWITPEAATSILREPQVVPMGITGPQFCAYCGGKVPAELLGKNAFKFCMHCGKQHPEGAQ